jgi:hypothetical protein
MARILPFLLLSSLVVAFCVPGSWNGSSASAASVAGSEPSLSDATSVTLFEKPNFAGRSLTFIRGVPSLAAVGFNDLASSVKIQGKRDWVLCEHRNFMGKCVRIHLKEKNLGRLKFLGVTSSAYPVPVVVSVPKPPRN